MVSCGLLARPGVGGEDVVDRQLLLQGYVVARNHGRNRGHDVDEAQPARHERLDAHLVGGVVDRRRRGTPLPRLPRQRHGREGLVVEREELPRLGPASSRRPAPRRAPGRATRGPSAIGIIIVGGLACTRVEPSVNSTIECTTLVGCTTTSIRSKGRSKSRCASITSSPLLTRVAELMVITGPIDQVGCLSACSSVTSASSSRVRPRNGPPLAVSTRRRTSAARAAAQALGDGGVLGVDRHDLAGLRARRDQRAAHDQRLLVGQREGGAGVERGQRRAQADGAGDAVEHDVARHARRLGGGVLAEAAEGRRELRDLAGRRAPRWSRPPSARRPGSGRGWRAPGRGPGCRWSPVEPRTTMSRLMTGSAARTSGSPRHQRRQDGIDHLAGCDGQQVSAVATGVPSMTRSGASPGTSAQPAGSVRPARIAVAQSSSPESSIVTTGTSPKSCDSGADHGQSGLRRGFAVEHGAHAGAGELDHRVLERRRVDEHDLGTQPDAEGLQHSARRHRPRSAAGRTSRVALRRAARPGRRGHG